MQTGLFITFEGIDGAGKSTHIETLAEKFKAQGRRVTLTREPGGTALAEQLRGLVLNDAMDALTEALLIFAARRDHVCQVIAPALARGDVVLCDRFSDASFAYQGAGRGFDWQVLSVLEQWVLELPGTHEPEEKSPLTPLLQRGEHLAQVLQPVMTLWFDLAPEVAAQRLSTARVPDKFEAQPLAFFQRVAQGYAQRAAQFPQRFVRIEAALPPEQVRQQLVQVLVQRGYLQ